MLEEVAYEKNLLFPIHPDWSFAHFNADGEGAGRL